MRRKQAELKRKAAAVAEEAATKAGRGGKRQKGWWEEAADGEGGGAPEEDDDVEWYRQEVRRARRGGGRGGDGCRAQGERGTGRWPGRRRPWRAGGGALGCAWRTAEAGGGGRSQRARSTRVGRRIQAKTPASSPALAGTSAPRRRRPVCACCLCRGSVGLGPHG